MDCFIPLLEQFHKTYGFYPKYPVTDAGYGSYNNYLYCEQHGMEKYMKFPMFKKRITRITGYRDNPFRAVNSRLTKTGFFAAQQDRPFIFDIEKISKGICTGVRKKSINVKTVLAVLTPRNAKRQIKIEPSV